MAGESKVIAELLVKIGVDAKDAEKAAGNLEKRFSNLEKRTKDLGRVADVTKKALVGIGGAVTALGFGALKTGATFEKLEAQLKTATGSAEGARDALAFVRDFAKNTPFQVEEITGAFIKLTNLGLNPSERALTSYGDTASAMGKDLDQLIEAVADATTGEFERLKEFGIKTRTEGENVSFTFRGITTTVGKNSKEIEDFLIGLGETNFAGAMSEQMGTLNGLISNLKDALSSFFLSVANQGPLEEFKKLISDLRDAAGDGSEGLATALAKTLTSAIRSVRELLSGDFVKTLESTAEAFRFVVENVDILIGIFAGARFAQALTSAAAGFSSMGIAAGAALGPIGAITGALIALIPLALKAGNALGNVLTQGQDIKLRAKKRGGAQKITDRFALEENQRKAARLESKIAGYESKLAEEQAKGFIERNPRLIEFYREKILEGQAGLSELDRQEAEFFPDIGEVPDEPITPVEPFKPPKPPKPPKTKARKKITSPTTVSEFFKAAAAGDLGPIAARTPSVKDIEPTVAVDITNNNYKFEVSQEIKGQADPIKIGEEAARAIKKEFEMRLSVAGQQLATSMVR